MRRHGFTLIELLAVMTIVALLLAVAAPRYFGSVDRAKDTALKQNLTTMRDAIQKYHADKGRYPDSLDALVAERYLRARPTDPITESPATWVELAPPDKEGKGLYDVHSGAKGKGQDGSVYADW